MDPQSIYNVCQVVAVPLFMAAVVWAVQGEEWLRVLRVRREHKERAMRGWE